MEFEIKAQDDETECWFCWQPILIGDWAYKNNGHVFCCQECSESHDYFDRYDSDN